MIDDKEHTRQQGTSQNRRGHETSLSEEKGTFIRDKTYTIQERREQRDKTYTKQNRTVLTIQDETLDRLKRTSSSSIYYLDNDTYF